MKKYKLGNYTIYCENSAEYHRIKREVWGEDCYYTEFATDKPVIIDAGAHIGVTTLYYKRLYPEARIVALEPQPETVIILNKNIWENQLEGVEVEQIALSNKEGEETFYFDRTKDKWYSTAGFTKGAWNEEQESEQIMVKTRRLSEYLEKYQPDLVKLDIEGAEGKVLREAQDKLRLCPHYLVEFHPVEGNSLEKIVNRFEERGYKVEVSKGGKVMPWHKARGMLMIEAIGKRKV